MDQAQARITENVRKLMGAREFYTQQALGDAIGKSKADMSNRMSGKTKWSLDDLLKLATALQVEPTALLIELRVSITGLAATGTDGGQVTIGPVAATPEAVPTIEATLGWESPKESLLRLAPSQVMAPGGDSHPVSPAVPDHILLPVTDLATERRHRRGADVAHRALSQVG